MKARHYLFICLTALFLAVWAPGIVHADVFTQCPCLDDPTAINLVKANGNIECTIPGILPAPDRNISCVHLTGGDGFATMADGAPIYIFGFSDMTPLYPPGGVYATKAEADAQVITTGLLDANFAAPTIHVNEGRDLYLTLTNVGMAVRRDLFDPHTVHFHGYGNAATVFDGEPMASLSINIANSLTYYYNINEPGTYMYHCHVEATEHMQMGMLGNLYVHPLQNGTDPGLNCTSQLYVYNDGDGSTCYDVEFPVQIHAFDPVFHAADQNVQPLPFAAMKDTYPMLNGRGYPDTINPADLPAPLDDQGDPLNSGLSPQKVNALIQATAGQNVLLRISSLSTTSYHTLQTTLGVPLRVVGKDARLLRGPNGEDLTYMTNSITLGGGESTDVIVDTTGVAPGTYFLYTTNLDHLSNEKEDFGGMMTEIFIN